MYLIYHLNIFPFQITLQQSSVFENLKAQSLCVQTSHFSTAIPTAPVLNVYHLPFLVTGVLMAIDALTTLQKIAEMMFLSMV